MGPTAPDGLVEEVRVAMALNGGVSLAVWMGGCAVELDAARRAHLGRVPERPLYAALCEAFQRELVIDLMSGASAGGLNGALLAGAIQKQRCLRPGFLRDRWLELGDFGKLLHPTSNPKPASLMQGELFADELTSTFKALIHDDTTKVDPRALPDATAIPPVLDVKLDITTTNIAGEAVSILDHWGASLQAREHRARFEFRKPDDYTVEALAQAARSSASFPVAFEPFPIGKDPALALASFAAPRWVVDGGLLDNAPIEAAIKLIPARPAHRQVRRFLVYVNADPVAEPPETEPDTEPKLEPQPTLFGVVGHAVNLPRQAPFVDQLYAIRDATQPVSERLEDPGLALLELDDGALAAAAGALLPAYQRQRLLRSLEDVTGDPAQARREAVQHRDGTDLPWIPGSLEPAPGGRWQWGLNAAVRALHLLIDALRPAIRAARVAEREPLLLARGRVYAERVALVAAYDERRAAGPADRGPLEREQAVSAEFDPRPWIRRGVEAVLEVRDLLSDRGAGLFGAGGDPVDTFTRRALAIEVIRRASYAEVPVDSAQQLAFVQLTPVSPGWLFTAKPWGHPGWGTPEDKLLGLGLAHFAGFYRRSWRANDFMWGRLDAAARIVDMLVSDDRAAQLMLDAVADPQRAIVPPWEVLARSLLPEDDPDGLSRKLVEEALGDAPEGYPGREKGDATQLGAAIQHDLTVAAQRGTLTRIVCTRAAQLEVFREEWPKLQAESAEDARLGGGTAALALGKDAASALASLRVGPPLPKRLCGGDEAASDLALETSAHAALVALGALRTASWAGKPLFAARAFVLPVAGAVARSRVNRAAVVVAFWAAVLFLAGRTLQTGGAADLNGAWTASLVVALFAFLCVVGVVLVPALRAALGHGAAREGLWAAGLALTGAGAIGAALLGGVSLTDVVAAPGAEEINAWVLGVVIAVVLGTPLVGIPALASKWVGRVVLMPWGGWLALPIASAAAIAAGALSLRFVLDALGDSWWQTAGGIAALLAGPLLAVRLLVPHR